MTGAGASGVLTAACKTRGPDHWGDRGRHSDCLRIMDERHCRQGSLLATVTGVGGGGGGEQERGDDKCVKTMDGDAELRSCCENRSRRPGLPSLINLLFLLT